MKWNAIKAYLKANGKYSDAQIDSWGKTVYDVYSLELKAGKIPVASTDNSSDLKKACEYIVQKTGLDYLFVWRFFVALNYSIEIGENSPGDLYIVTAQKIQQNKADEFRKKLGLDFLGNAAKRIIVVLSVAGIAFVLYKYKPKPVTREA